MVDFNKMLREEREKKMAGVKKGKELATTAKDKKLVKFNYEEEMAKLAKEAADSEKLPAGNFASLKGGLFIGGNRMKDDKVDCVILGSVLENDYYVGKYDPDEKNPPACWAFGNKEEELRPAKEALGYWDVETKAFVKPDSCTGCPMNEWGSADTGKGKKCQNRRRLGFISANGAEDPDFVSTADLVQLKIPVTSVRPWQGYVHAVAEAGFHPAFVVTTMERVHDNKTQFKVNFQMGAALEPELLPIIKDRRTEVAKALTAPYQAIDPDLAKALATGKKAKGDAKKPAAGKGKF